MAAGRYINNAICGGQRIKRAATVGEENAGVARIYVKPAHSGATTIYHTYDDRWKRANNVGEIDYSDGNTIMELDPDNFWKIKPLNIHGHYWRLTGETGGYYDTATSQYKTINGTVTTKTVAFPGNVMQCHHTGLMLPTAPAFLQALYVDGGVNSFNDVANFSLAGYDDWFIPDATEILAFMDLSKSTPATTPPLDGWNGAYQKWTATTYAANTTQAWALQLQGYVAATTKSTVRAVIPIRHWA